MPLIKCIFLMVLFLVNYTKVISQNKGIPVKLNKTVIIDSVTTALQKYYIFPDKAKEMADHIKKQYLKKAYDAVTDPGDLAVSITKDLRTVFPDRHLVIRYDPKLEKRISDFTKTSQPDKTDFQKELKQNFFFRKTEILPGNIGYVVFTNFADTNVFSRKIVQAAFQFVANTDALIIDLRNNFGGNPSMAAEITSYFFEAPTFTGRSYSRLTDSWTEQWVGKNPEKKNGIYLQMPVFILTSNRTYSAAEGLAYTLQNLKNAKIAGDTTRGSAHVTRSFALGNGFVGFIPYGRIENTLTKTDWEGTGMIPDFPVKEETALLKAQEEIYKLKLKKTQDSTEVRSIQWLLNDLKAKTSAIKIDSEKLADYTGQFEEFLFTSENGELYCKNTHQKDKTDKLTSITETLFRIDSQTQVEFIKDSQGKFSSIKLYWNDGWVDVVKRD
jgi:retinol-binding protein 3